MKHIKKVTVKKAVEGVTTPEDLYDFLITALTDGKKGTPVS